MRVLTSASRTPRAWHPAGNGMMSTSGPASARTGASKRQARRSPAASNASATASAPSGGRAETRTSTKSRSFPGGSDGVRRSEPSAMNHLSAMRAPRTSPSAMIFARATTNAPGATVWA